MAGTSEDARKRMKIYLQDHFAGSVVGIELARRTAKANRGTAFGGPLTQIANEIEEDRDELKRIMGSVDVSADPIKSGIAWGAEKAGRLKPNGQLRGYSPLSRHLEIEGLISGVIGKLSLWRSLSAIEPQDSRLDAARLGELEDRAQDQLERLHALSARAAVLAFGGS